MLCSHDPGGALAEADVVLGLRGGAPACWPSRDGHDADDRGAVPVSARPRAAGRRPGDGGRRRAAQVREAGRTVGALLRKELLVELRTLESVPGMSLFAVTTFVVFHFALNRNSVEGDLAAGILWVTLLFAAMLGVNRLFVADADQGGFDGFLLAPVDRSAMLLAKALDAAGLPGRARARSPCPLSPFCCWRRRSDHALPDLLGVLALADLGVAAIGTLVGGARGAHARARPARAAAGAAAARADRDRRRARELAAAGARPSPATPQRAGC